MSAGELTDAFEAGEIDGANFPHESHLWVAWTLARRYGHDDGLSRMRAGLQGIAGRAGRPEVYHETITKAWFELIASVDHLDGHPELCDRRLLARYYSADVLESGRKRWVEPDLLPLVLDPEPGAAAGGPVVGLEPEHEPERDRPEADQHEDERDPPGAAAVHRVVDERGVGAGDPVRHP